MGSRSKGPTEIAKVEARQVLDSRGNPTVEAEIWTFSGLAARAAVPSGASTGKHEAIELRDADKEVFHGLGVLKAVANVTERIRPKILGIDCRDQETIDRTMIDLDGTDDKRELGANSILAVSMAAARLASAAGGEPLYKRLRRRAKYRLPVPMMNIINGGRHAGNRLAIQEFLIEPVAAKSMNEAVRFGSEVYHVLRSTLKGRFGPSSINVGDEGGFAPPFGDSAQALDVIIEAISEAGFAESEIRLGIDPAASGFYDQRTSKYRMDGRERSGDEMLDYYLSLAKKYRLLTIEDPFDEEDFPAFREITRRLKGKVMVIGDDLYATSPERIRKGVSLRATSAVLVKPNQIGTVTETMEAVGIARAAGLAVVVSHRSGETEDVFIAHLATAIESEFIKTGALARGERVAKYNELLRIEEGLGSRACFAGTPVIKG
ncbi:MAG: phosphopyruvate hydratase [Nitrososphaerota archaeon]|nr:phosphopyruvate hydratase [Nitrososphaerota archaeon]